MLNASTASTMTRPGKSETHGASARPPIAVVESAHVSIVFIEQNVELALRLADRGYILETGCTILTGPSAELLQSGEVKRIFLGDVAL